MAPLFDKLKNLLKPATPKVEAAIDPSQFGYPDLGPSQPYPEGPKHSIINLKHRLVLARVGAGGDLAGEYTRQNLKTLLDLEPYWTRATIGEPPFSLSPEQEEDFLTAVAAFFEFHAYDVDTVLCAFGFLEFFSRGSFKRRELLAGMLPDELDRHRRYLVNIASFRAEELKPRPPQVEDPDRALTEWILPHLQKHAGLTDDELGALREKIDDFEGLLHALKGSPEGKPSDEARKNPISILLRNRAIDPDDPISDELRVKLEQAYEVELSVVVCKRCQNGHRPAAMKTPDICWGCWD